MVEPFRPGEGSSTPNQSRNRPPTANTIDFIENRLDNSGNFSPFRGSDVVFSPDLNRYVARDGPGVVNSFIDSGPALSPALNKFVQPGDLMRVPARHAEFEAAMHKFYLEAYQVVKSDFKPKEPMDYTTPDLFLILDRIMKNIKPGRGKRGFLPQLKDIGWFFRSENSESVNLRSLTDCIPAKDYGNLVIAGFTVILTVVSHQERLLESAVDVLAEIPRRLIEILVRPATINYRSLELEIRAKEVFQSMFRILEAVMSLLRKILLVKGNFVKYLPKHDRHIKDALANFEIEIQRLKEVGLSMLNQRVNAISQSLPSANLRNINIFGELLSGLERGRRQSVNVVDSDLRDILQLAAPGTATRFLDSLELKKWLSSPDQRFFCPGLAGTGKTVLAALVIQRLQEKYHNDPSVGIAYFWSQRVRNKDMYKPERLFENFIRQLGNRSPESRAVLEKYKLDLNEKSGEWNASLEIVSEALGTLISKFKRTFFVIDGLDQIPSSQWRSLLWESCPIRGKSKSNILVMARPLPDIAKELNPTIKLEVTPDGQEVWKSVERSFVSLKPYSDAKVEHKEKFREIFVKIAKGSMQIAKLITTTLEAKSSQSLQDFMTSLDNKTVQAEALGSHYHSILDGLQAQPNNTHLMATIKWMIYSQRPLTEVELRTALGAELADGGEFSLELFNEVVCLCSSIITVNDGKCFFGHETAVTFIEEKKAKLFPSAESQIAGTCIRILSENGREGACWTDSDYEKRLSTFPLYSYAAKFWAIHARLASVPPTQQILRFLKDKNKVQAVCQAVFSKPLPNVDGYSQHYDKQITGLHLAAEHGFSFVIEDLQKSYQEPGQDTTPVDSQGRTPLWYAARNNHKDAMIILSPNDKDTLRKMILAKQTASVKRLVQAAGRNLRDYRDRTPLHIAVLQNDKDLVQVCIEAKINVNAKDCKGVTAVMMAVRTSRPELVVILLNNGANRSEIKIDAWLQAYGRGKMADVTRIPKGLIQGDVGFFTDAEFCDQFKNLSDPSDLSKTTGSLFIFNDCADWCKTVPGGNHPDSEANKLNFISEAAYGDESQHHSIVVSYPVYAKPKYDKLFAISNREMRVSWTTSLFTDNKQNDASWISHSYFSTLTDISMPETGAALFRSLLSHLTEEWIDLCDSIDNHLRICRSELLDTEKRDPKLLRRLLQDAKEWIDIQRIFQDQAQAIREFRDIYILYEYEEKELEKATKTFDDMVTKVEERLSTFDATSQSLISIEFNLVSIVEAQRSTSTNRSMKRLTWITFVFLPLTFISGVFGMNINILQNNPEWWWYLIFASVTTILTVSIWIIFKRIPHLEDRIQRKFKWLVGPGDEEEALLHLKPRALTAEWIAAQKKAAEKEAAEEKAAKKETAREKARYKKAAKEKAAREKAERKKAAGMKAFYLKAAITKFARKKTL